MYTVFSAVWLLNLTSYNARVFNSTSWIIYLHFFNSVKLNVTLFWKNNDNNDDDDHDDGDDENDGGDDDENDNENDDNDADDDNIRLKRWPRTTLYS